MKLDIAKIFRTQLSPYNSLRNVDECLRDLDVWRLVDVDWTRHLPKQLIKIYAKDDWDVMAIDESLQLSDIFHWESAIFKFVPIMYYAHACLITTTWPGYKESYNALREAGHMLVSTESWFNSEFHRQTALGHFSQFLTPQIMDELWGKCKVMQLGIKPKELVSPSAIPTDSIRIFYPARMTVDKGLLEFCQFLRKFHAKYPSVEIAVVSRDGKRKDWRELNFIKKEIFGWLDYSAYLDVAKTCDYIFSYPKHENFGIATLEAVAMGCHPIVYNGKAYPETVPEDFRFDSVDEAVQMVIQSLGTTFDNSFVSKFFWTNREAEWRSAFSRMYEDFYKNVVVTKAGQKMVDIVRTTPMNKKDLMKAMGWARMEGWGKYRRMLKMSVPISIGPNPIFGSNKSSSSLVVEEGVLF